MTAQKYRRMKFQKGGTESCVGHCNITEESSVGRGVGFSTEEILGDKQAIE